MTQLFNFVGRVFHFLFFLWHSTFNIQLNVFILSLKRSIIVFMLQVAIWGWDFHIHTCNVESKGRLPCHLHSVSLPQVFQLEHVEFWQGTPAQKWWRGHNKLRAARRLWPDGEEGRWHSTFGGLGLIASPCEGLNCPRWECGWSLLHPHYKTLTLGAWGVKKNTKISKKYGSGEWSRHGKTKWLILTSSQQTE